MEDRKTRSAKRRRPGGLEESPSPPAHGKNAPVPATETLETQTHDAAILPATVRPRNLHLREDVFLRLRLWAMTQGRSASSVAEEILDHHLPQLEIRQVG